MSDLLPSEWAHPPSGRTVDVPALMSHLRACSPELREWLAESFVRGGDIPEGFVDVFLQEVRK